MGLVDSLRFFGNVLFFRLKAGSPRDYFGQWDSYWKTIHATGRGGEVLWDNEPERASVDDLRRFEAHMDRSLPILDLGCGNGRQSRFLARKFKTVVGVDVSPAAVELARTETRAEKNIHYRVLNGAHPDEARALHAEFGDMNIYIRTVLHVVQQADRPNFIESLRILLGERGTLYSIELSVGALSYFKTLPGDSPSGLPRLVHNVIRHGVVPIGFTEDDRQRFFPESDWEVFAEGIDAVINTVPLSHGAEGKVPAYYMIARPRAASQSPGAAVPEQRATA
jgi:SAM-dependent methyltransferase